MELRNSKVASWILAHTRTVQLFVAIPHLLTLIFVVDVAAYFGGLLFWYAYVMADPATPIWAWPFIPDCPLFGLLGGIGLLMATAKRFWSHHACRQAQRTMLVAGVLCGLLWLAGYAPGLGPDWTQHRAMFGLLAGVLILAGALFERAPGWLLAIFAFGQIKYGVWTVTAWSLFWVNTAEILGSPQFTVDGILMTVSHVGLFAQGVLLLTYFRPGLVAAGASLIWFVASDIVDYGLGFYPALPEDLIPLPAMQWSTVTMTLLLVVLYLWSGIAKQWIAVAGSYPSALEGGSHSI